MKVPARLIVAVLFGAGLASGTIAQTPQPFDMTGERSGVDTPAEFAPSPEVPAVPAYRPQPPSAESEREAAPKPAPRNVAPSMVPAIGPNPAIEDGDPMPTAQPAPPAATEAADAPSVPSPSPMAPAAEPANATSPAAGSAGRIDGFNRRYVVPSPTFRLAGENDQSSWSIHLTADQVARQAQLAVSYKNAIVVMPEASRLRVSINGQVVLETPLASSDNFRTVMADLPAGLLQAGPNLLRFQAYQRHRTDCSIQSTYELWTDIDAAGTTLAFKPQNESSPLRSLEDLPAVGYDAEGRTTIRILTPHANETAVAPHLLKLVQALSLYGNYPNPSVVISDEAGAADGAGSLTVVVAPARELETFLTAPFEAAATQPVVSFTEEPGLGSAVLVVSGPGWSQIGAAVDALAERVDRPLGVTRTSLNTASWFAPDVHLFTRQETVSLNRLGVSTQQFSGRRFRATFGVGIPSDFYAEAYGEATLLLDAAYTPAVLPASHIDIYVNGEIAATTRIVSRAGGIFRHLPIQIPFRHFHPGVNRITIEAALDTEADRACGPGGATAGPDRFVLFDTSAFSMPAFARIARQPNLAAFSGTGFPYNRQPSALVLGRTDPKVVAASATLLGRLANQAGRIIPTTLSPLGSVGDQSAIFVGAVPQFTAGILDRLGLSEDVRTSWRADAALAAPAAGMSAALARNEGVLLPPDAESERTDVLFDRWRDELADGGGWRGQVSGLEDWLKRTFDISFSTLRIGPAAPSTYEPRPKTTILLAQALSPNGSGTWTLVTAPNDDQLLTGIRSLVAIENWSNVGGEFSSFSTTTGRVENQPPTSVAFVQTQPFSAQNLRLIAANWLSSNIVFYAVGLIALCVLLGVATSGLLHRLGRPS